MTPTDWSWSERYESPTLVSQPQPAPQQNISNYFNNSRLYTRNPFLSNPYPPPQPESPKHTPPHWTLPTLNPPSHTPLLPTTSRKRSHDEFSDPEDLSPALSNPIHAAPSPPKLHPAYGQGMPLVQHNVPSSTTESALAASSKSDAWTEDLSSRLRSTSVSTAARPGLVPRKSMRLDPTTPSLDNDAAALPTDLRTGPCIASPPTIDVATHTLGVSWSTLPCTPTMDAAARGWARHIERHFPLREVRIVWQNRGEAPGYLVSAVEAGGEQGYWLFEEGLGRGRFVAGSLEGAVQGLRGPLVGIEGEKVLVRGVGVGSVALEGNEEAMGMEMDL